MKVSIEQIRRYRLKAHHLDQKIPLDTMIEAAGACGLQNSPPGAWETALHNRLTGCSLEVLHDALYCKKTLLQAWSYRGAPVVFPQSQSDVFLTSLIAQEGEEPWIYTRGISGALDHLGMGFYDVLGRLKVAIRYLDKHTIKSKETLDRTLAEIIYEDLPHGKQALWRGPSMYGDPTRQTVGDATVSFLLRPCSFSSLVVFGERDHSSPTFTSYRNWVGRIPDKIVNADKGLVRKFLHCYGPTTRDSLMNWLGCSPRQSHRLWNTVTDEIVAVETQERTAYMLEEDVASLCSSDNDGNKLMLLGAHDPYLDLKDRTVILEDKTLYKEVWKTIANPGVILRGGQIIGTWKSRSHKDKINVLMTTWGSLNQSHQKTLKGLAEEYIAFRLRRPGLITVEHM